MLWELLRAAPTTEASTAVSSEARRSTCLERPIRGRALNRAQDDEGGTTNGCGPGVMETSRRHRVAEHVASKTNRSGLRAEPSSAAVPAAPNRPGLRAEDVAL